MQLNKEELRKQAKGKILTLDLKEISRAVLDRLLVLPEWHMAKGVLMYYPLSDEIDVLPLIEHAAKDNKRIYLPKDIERGIYFSEFNNDTFQYLEPNNWGIMECESETLNDFKVIDLIIIPALMYDRRRYRLGRGAGYYDRLLLQNPHLKSIGLIPSELITEKLPADSWDLQVNYLISDGEMIK